MSEHECVARGLCWPMEEASYGRRSGGIIGEGTYVSLVRHMKHKVYTCARKGCFVFARPRPVGSSSSTEKTLSKGLRVILDCNAPDICAIKRVKALISGERRNAFSFFKNRRLGSA